MTYRPLYVGRQNDPPGPQALAVRLGWPCALAAAYVVAVGLLCAFVIAAPEPTTIYDCITDAECEAAWLDVTVEACALFTCEGGHLR